MTVRLAVLLSGGGRTLQNFIDQIAAGRLDARIEIVVASNAGAAGIEKARAAGLECVVVDRRQYADDESFSDAVSAVVDGFEIDFILLAGFLRRYVFPERYAGRVLNIHPGPLPKYGGKGMYGHHVHEAVLASGDRESACAVIIADHEYDHGPVVLQESVPVLPGDTPETLAARVFEAECEAYPEAVRRLAARLKDVGSADGAGPPA
jgi:formyltetrahydrofolate-dependent phosphoribosylglycinamide formyltransferase